MRTGEYKLIIKWDTGEKQEYIYPDRNSAEEAEKGFFKVFGNQIVWAGIDPVFVK